MTNRLKYGSKQVFWDKRNRQVVNPLSIEKRPGTGKLILPDHIERFDSTLEFKVYQKLLDLYGEKRITRQYSLEIFPPGYCYPKGKYWRVDFAIRSIYTPPAFAQFVEAKGIVLPEFRHTLAALESHNELAFCKLRIVFAHELPGNSSFIKNLMKTDFDAQMYSLKHFEKLKRLP